ncbi:MAG: hypothetical protein U0840_25340 [Gemmataceae bacterium]
MAWTTRDVTERRQAEERLLLAVGTARMGTIKIDLQTDVVGVNELGREIYGWPAVRTTFVQLQTHTHPDDRKDVMRKVGIAFDPEGPGEFEIE